MKLKDQYYELTKLRKKKEAVESLKGTGIGKETLQTLFTTEDNKRLNELEKELKANEKLYEVDCSILISEIQSELNKQAGGEYWKRKVERNVKETRCEYFEGTEYNHYYDYTLSLRFGVREFIITKIFTLNNDIYLDLSTNTSDEKVSLLQCDDTDIDLDKLTNYHLNPPKKDPIGYMDALERGVWNTVKKNRVMQLTKQMTEKQKELRNAQNTVTALTSDIETLQAEIKDAEM